MTLSLKALLITSVAIAAIAYGLGRYASPVKTVEVEKVVKEIDHDTTTRDTKRPDGTVIHEVIVKDKTKTEKDTTKIVDNKKPDWFLAGGYGLNGTAYSLEANRRILGAVFVGAQVTYIPDKDNVVLVKVGYEF